MKTIKGRKQGAWRHPTLYEIGKAVGCCHEMRFQNGSAPCHRRGRTREEWCDPCKASDALSEVANILLTLTAHSNCRCKDCQLVRAFISNGQHNREKYTE